MPQLSVVIITFNEERNIARCLDSVKMIADDIVVVDSYSSDKTREIAESRGARVVLHEFAGHIEQKNWAITQARYPFILSLDADEALSEELERSIAEVKKNKQHDGYTMNRLTNYCGKWVRHCGWYPDTKLRLWDSAKGKWGGVNPHDKYELEMGAAIVHLKGDILHYSYYTRSDHYHQINKFTDISANSMFNMGRKANIIKVYFSPVFKFVRDYILLHGFLDGYTGFTISRISAYAAFLKYAKLRQLNKQKGQ
jgi:glycosyltransferase involved in cell wall biosynthesis